MIEWLENDSLTELEGNDKIWVKTLAAAIIFFAFLCQNSFIYSENRRRHILTIHRNKKDAGN
jgi:hypothetical protein